MATFSVVLVIPEFIPPAMKQFCTHLNTKAMITRGEKFKILQEFQGITRKSAFWMPEALYRFVLTTTSSTCPFANHLFADSA
jgi:hypothetical protein